MLVYLACISDVFCLYKIIKNCTIMKNGKFNIFALDSSFIRVIYGHTLEEIARADIEQNALRIYLVMLLNEIDAFVPWCSATIADVAHGPPLNEPDTFLIN